jgi:hypothetical protein
MLSAFRMTRIEILRPKKRGLRMTTRFLQCSEWQGEILPAKNHAVRMTGPTIVQETLPDEGMCGGYNRLRVGNSAFSSRHAKVVRGWIQKTGRH